MAVQLEAATYKLQHCLSVQLANGITNTCNHILSFAIDQNQSARCRGSRAGDSALRCERNKGFTPVPAVIDPDWSSCGGPLFLAGLWCRWWKWAGHFWSTARVWEQHSTCLDSFSLNWHSRAAVWHNRTTQPLGLEWTEMEIKQTSAFSF